MAFRKQDSVVAAAFALVKELKAPITLTTLKDKLENHPDFPSLSSVDEVLQSFDINTLAIQVSKDELNEVPTPCIAPLYIEKGVFAIIHSVKDGFIEWWISGKKKQREPISTFSEKWMGIILLVKTSQTSGENNYKKNRQKEILFVLSQIILTLGFITLIILSVYFVLNIQNAILNFNLIGLIATKFIGIVISIILLWHIIDKDNPFVKNLCQFGKSANCNSVLNSKAASIKGIISWSEIGFFYFTGSLLGLLLGLSSKNILSILFVLNLLALPYSIFSIYYQYWVVKKWCALCLSVQIILWVEFLFFFTGNNLYFSLNLNLNDFLILVSSFLSPVVIWFLIKPILQFAVQASSLKKKLKTFQNNIGIFNQLLSEQTKMVTTQQVLNILESGNPNASNIITIITDPYCKPCAKQHSMVRQILFENSDNVKCQTIFFATNAEKDIRGEFVRHLYCLDKENQDIALDSWFRLEEKEYKIWKLIYPIEKTEQMSFDIVNSHFNWCMKSKIRSTPTLFINGYKLPEVYTIEDFQRISKYYFAQNNVGNKAASINP